MEWRGLALCIYITLESLLCMTSPLEHDTCTLEWTSYLCGLQSVSFLAREVLRMYVLYGEVTLYLHY